MRRALLALAESVELSASSWRVLLETAHSIGSDSSCASFLSTIAGRMPKDDETRRAYLKTLGTIGSSSEYRRASEALLSSI